MTFSDVFFLGALRVKSYSREKVRQRVREKMAFGPLQDQNFVIRRKQTAWLEVLCRQDRYFFCDRKVLGLCKSIKRCLYEVKG